VNRSKKKFVGALAGIAVVGATVAVTSGTFSYFSDSTTLAGAGGSVSMGTIKLEAGSSAGNTPFSITNAKPGQTILVSSLGFSNTGSLGGVLRLKFIPDPTNSAEFNNDVLISLDGNGYYPASVPLNSLQTLAFDANLTKDGMQVSPMFAGRHKSMPITVKIDPNAGNALQGQSGSFTIEADLIQATDDPAGSPASIPDNPTAAFPAPPAS
jgi:hypothetical protein